MSAPIPLAGLTRDEIAGALGRVPRPELRAKQIAEWVYRKGATRFEEMTDLPADLRNSLQGRFLLERLELIARQDSRDGVTKLLVHGGDGQGFECVLLPFSGRVSCCISSQVGCALGCEFCATGLGGFDRNLDPGEIVAQYLMLQKLTPRRISHVVFMGMGEPLQNYEAVLKAVRLFHGEVGLSYRHITISTVGIVPAIRRLAAERLPIHLAVSLHSPLDEVRTSLMPVNRKWPVSVLLDACREYFGATGRKITFEYLLINEITDTEAQAEALASLVKGFQCLVNLIPFNQVNTARGFSRPSRHRVRRFRTILETAGVNVSQRMERGHDIAAACGQLAGRHEGKFAKRRSLCAATSSHS